MDGDHEAEQGPGMVGTSVILALWKHRQNDYCKFHTSLGYIVRPCLKKIIIIIKAGHGGGICL